MHFKLLLALIFFTGCIFAQSSKSTDTRDTGITNVTVPAVTPVLPDLKPELEAQGKEIDKIKAAEAKLENAYKELSVKFDALIKSNSEILGSLKSLETGMKLYTEKLSAEDKSIESLKVRLDEVNEEIAAINKKVETDKVILTGLKTQSESFKVKLDIAQDDIKVRSDEIKALKDAMSIMRSNINSNTTDTIELKKLVNELKAKESGKPAEGIMAWEYLGIVTSGVAVLALVLSIVK